MLVAATAAAVILASMLSSGSTTPIRADIEPHLGYGVNLRYLENVEPVFDPLEFTWVKVYERFDTLPDERLPYNVLYRIDVNHGDRWTWVNSQPFRPDLDKIRADVHEIALDGLGKVDAYEIGNETNMDWQWMGVTPDPADFVAVLRVAYQEIKAVDPSAVVVSGGLGPVGRIGGPTGDSAVCCGNSGACYLGNNCGAMDERLYAIEMFERGAGQYFDVFAYHPYGFVYEPERSLSDLPWHDNGNGFCFRGAEAMRDLLIQYGLGERPMWATEFGWVRDPSSDGYSWCHTSGDFAPAEWFDVPEDTQADYLVRSFEYADANWPWMEVMFLWSLDFHQEGAVCWPGTFFSVRKRNGTVLGGGSLGYEALVSMAKRTASFGARLVVTPRSLVFVADVDEPGVQTAELLPDNSGPGGMGWTARASPGMALLPGFSPENGVQGIPLTVSVNSAGYGVGTFSGRVVVSSTIAGVVDVPQVVPVELVVMRDVRKTYIPLVMREQ